jgi:hypothetical protein
VANTVASTARGTGPRTAETHSPRQNRNAVDPAPARFQRESYFSFHIFTPWRRLHGSVLFLSLLIPKVGNNIVGKKWSEFLILSE